MLERVCADDVTYVDDDVTYEERECVRECVCCRLPFVGRVATTMCMYILFLSLLSRARSLFSLSFFLSFSVSFFLFSLPLSRALSVSRSHSLARAPARVRSLSLSLSLARSLFLFSTRLVRCRVNAQSARVTKRGPTDTHAR